MGAPPVLASEPPVTADQRPKAPAASSDPFECAQSSGRTKGQLTNRQRSIDVAGIWGEYLDKLKLEFSAAGRHLTPSASGCMLYLWWAHEGYSMDYVLPGRKKSYEPETMIRFAKHWAQVSKVWSA
jgi:hypothetical protein